MTNTDSRDFSQRRASHCWSCRKRVDNERQTECFVCRWIICKCGECGCNYNKPRSPRISKSPAKREETDAKIVRIENKIIDELGIISRASIVDLNKAEAIFLQIFTEIRQRFNDRLCAQFERYFNIKVEEFCDQDPENLRKRDISKGLINLWSEVFRARKANVKPCRSPIMFNFEERFQELRYQNGSCPFCRRIIHVSKEAFKNHLSKNCQKLN
jgi:hypothetical protein